MKHIYMDTVYKLSNTDHFNLQNKYTVIKEEMVDTPFAVISREPERVKVSLV